MIKIKAKVDLSNVDEVTNEWQIGDVKIPNQLVVAPTWCNNLLSLFVKNLAQD